MDDEVLMHEMMHITHRSILYTRAGGQERCMRMYVGWWTFTHLVAKRAGAVVGACDITHTCAVVLTGSHQTGGALGHQIQICWTLALELTERGGKQQAVCHVGWSSAAGDARLFKPSLHPLRQPAQLAVTVQGVRTQSPGSHKHKL